MVVQLTCDRIVKTETGQWRSGFFRAKNSIMTHTGTNAAWPGWNHNNQAINDRYVIDIEGATLRSDNQWSLHFEGAAPAGHNLERVDLTGGGVGIIAGLGLIDWIGVAFGNASIADGSAQNNTAYRQGPQISGVARTFVQDGFF